MKKNRAIILLLCLGLLFSSVSSPRSEEPETPIPKEKVIALAKQIESQQKEIEANQIKIDEELADIYEMVRQAWVFSRRAQK